ncbi:MAG: hypothetical protein AAF581_22610 [Planctomycetota bacterium]
MKTLQRWCRRTAWSLPCLLLVVLPQLAMPQLAGAQTSSPIATCGVLISVGADFVLQTDGGDVYVMNSTGLFAAGDRVFVEGLLDVGCGTTLGGCVSPTNITLCGQELFTRGDCNRDGSRNVGDAVTVLTALFVSFGVVIDVGCLDACDGNDDGGVDVSDAVTLLHGLFFNQQLPMPFPGCGIDPTDQDSLTCNEPSPCP